MTKAVIFDFGGVVTRTLFETHDLTERALGLPSGSLQWRGPFDPASDTYWRAMQADDISERDYWMKRTLETGALIGENWTQMADFVKAARGAHPAEVIRPEFLSFVEDAKKSGVRLAILSNELDLFYGVEFREKLPFLADFELIHDATYTKILKPDPKAYTACLDDLGLQASECVFVDDQLRNINGANAVGLVSVHFDVQNPAGSFLEIYRKTGMPQAEGGNYA
ncbi:HAD-IA family hydrolase [Cochlodiniinecator piscidefendens]|uniref:HAD-IA family hydrolase n=1 Tax=Cochlodiniinecator piscidefendens TaxID=2715756 RepID=UPI00140A60B0|nr:HAD-IA family hydrolase [Cochlodiniinecator piscidefendens]